MKYFFIFLLLVFSFGSTAGGIDEEDEYTGSADSIWSQETNGVEEVVDSEEAGVDAAADEYTDSTDSKETNGVEEVVDSEEAGVDAAADEYTDSTDSKETNGVEEVVDSEETGVDDIENIDPSLAVPTALVARNGMLVSQVLRLFFEQQGYSLYYSAKYDCRLSSSATLEGGNFKEVLIKFLRSFSLSAKINADNKVVNVFAANSSARICTPIDDRDSLSDNNFINEGEK